MPAVAAVTMATLPCSLLGGPMATRVETSYLLQCLTRRWRSGAAAAFQESQKLSGGAGNRDKLTKDATQGREIASQRAVTVKPLLPATPRDCAKRQMARGFRFSGRQD